jgi:hypothetical protein
VQPDRAGDARRSRPEFARRCDTSRRVSVREMASLREDAAALCGALADSARRRFADVPSSSAGAADLVRAHRLASSEEGLAQAAEALDSATTPARRARLAALRDFLVRARALSLEPRAVQEIWDAPRRRSVRLSGDPGLHGPVPPVVVERELPFERSRERRADMELALAASERGLDGVRASLWDAAVAALGEIGEPLEVAAALHERGWAEPEPPPAPTGPPNVPAGLVKPEREEPPARDPIGDACEAFLRDTDSIARDLGGWLLERSSGARPFPGGATRQDVLHLVHAPRCASAFPRGELLRTCRRWAEMFRLDLTASGLIALDEDEKPLRSPGARAFPVDPPHQVAIVLLPEEGPRALSALLGALGVAQLRAGPPPDAPPEDLWFGDAALEPACASLFASLLLDPLWLRRCAHADLSRDDERGLAIAQLFDARLAAARALASLAAHRSGLSGAAEDAMRDLYARACRAELPSGLGVRELDPWLDAWAELRGRAFAARLRGALRDRYDEDWWRNPRALPVLQGLWGRGGRPTLRELWSELGGSASVAPLVSDLTEACG